MRPKLSFYRWGKFLILAILVAFTIFPVYIMAKVSLSSPQEIFTQHPPYIIKSFTLSHWQKVFSSGKAFINPLKKSLLVAISAAIMALILAIPAAYAISRLDPKIRYTLILILFFSRMFPEVSIALPIAVRFIGWGLFDTSLGLSLAHLVRILPVACFILVGTFRAIPIDLESQAQVDGCSRLGALCHVVLPLSLVGVAVAGIFSFLLSWDEFIYASYLCLAEPTMPLKMYYYVDRGSIFYSATYAVIITIPVLILTYSLQKYLRPGYLAGSVKG